MSHSPPKAEAAAAVVEEVPSDFRNGRAGALEEDTFDSDRSIPKVDPKVEKAPVPAFCRAVTSPLPLKGSAIRVFPAASRLAFLVT